MTAEFSSSLRNLLQAGRDLTPAMRRIAAALQDSVAEAFNRQVSPDGIPWAPLSDVWQRPENLAVDQTLEVCGDARCERMVVGENTKLDVLIPRRVGEIGRRDEHGLAIRYDRFRMENCRRSAPDK